MAMNLRLSDELHQSLREQAAAENISVQVLMVKAAEHYLHRNGKRALIDTALDRILVESGPALKRLGEGA